MPLPSPGETAWPPVQYSEVYRRYREHSAWYSGDVNQLADFYTAGYTFNYRRGEQMGAGATGAGQAPVYSGFWRINFDRFWARVTTAPWRRLMLHIPISADISTASADLLFADPPKSVVDGAHTRTATPGAKVIQDRIDEIFEEASLAAVFTEAAETASALGGVFLRVTWDKDVEPRHPLLTSVDADSAVPEFRWGCLTAVTFWRVINAEDGDNKKVWRHLERHEPGVILHGLYCGNEEFLGDQMPLSMMGDDWLSEDTAPLAEVVETGVPMLTAVYVPNMRPNRVWRGSELGRSDYDGVEAMMDSLDETWTSWMRDLRLGRARIIVPEEYLDPQGQGKGAAMDLDQEVFEKLPMAVSRDQGTITPNQFQIRAADHAATSQALLERIVAAAGYSSTTFGLDEVQRGVTATEIVSRERRSYTTREKKIRHWKKPLSQILEVLLAVDVAQGFDSHGVDRPRADFPEAVQEDPGKVAAAVVTLRQAMAASTETLVSMSHPSWTPEEVAAEVKKIMDEQMLLHVKPGGPVTLDTVPGQQPKEGKGAASLGTPGDSSSVTPVIRRGAEGLPAGATQGGPE